MSTRSYICIEKEDGSYKGIYCHHDGYLEYNGKMLVDNYNDREKVMKLISLGDLSSLQKNIEPNPKYPHSFDYDTRQKGVCIFYGRDRGETGTEARDVTFERAKESWCEYMYVFRRDNEWYYTDLYGNEPRWRMVKRELEQKYNTCQIKDDCVKISKRFDNEM